jgi:TetR/AcrR family transcriptional repressor of nem operon
MQRNGQAARSRARAIATLCVGGMVLARSIEDRVLANEIRDCSRWREEFNDAVGENRFE